MFNLKLLLLVTFALTLSGLSLDATVTKKQILESADKELSLCGVLKQVGDFIYLKVDDDYINKLGKELIDDGFELPDYFSLKANYVGAHISVVYPYESHYLNKAKIRELGSTINFKLIKIKIINSYFEQSDLKSLYWIIVESPELDLIRESYGLPKSKYPFHITIGVKPKKQS